MDARHPIQTANEPIVLSCVFNESGTRFACGLDTGVRVFRATDCIRTLNESPNPGGGYAIAVALDDRYLALVGGGRQPNASPNKLQFWDNLHGRLITVLDFAEPVLGVRLTTDYMAVILLERVVFFQYAYNTTKDDTGPFTVGAIHDTAPNPFAICSIQNDVAVLPGLTAGQIQVVWLAQKTKKIVRAHSSNLRHVHLSQDGQVIATSSQQGTLIRVFSVSRMVQTHEFRRGVDAADIFSLSISPRSQFVACTSDKGTLHVFDLRSAASEDQKPAVVQKRTSFSRPAAHPRRPGSVDFDASSLQSQSSSPRPSSHQGVYVGPPEDITHSPPINAPSALSALARLPGMPRAFSDARSMTSATYHLGSDPVNWQGQPAFIPTTLPNSQRAKVSNPNVPVPGHPNGRPPKGILCWDPLGSDKRIWCVSAGVDARWELFELAEGSDGRLRLNKTGYRKYLDRQFPDERR